jgi:aspartyl aminopeptidase
VLKAVHGIDVADLAAAELALVPAGPARDVGLDRAMVGGYGQDDRACAYAALRAILETRAPRHTAIVLLVDKEEVGSTGNTGAQSAFFRRLVAELAEGLGAAGDEAALDRILAASIVFSADVTGGLNPAYAPVYEPRSATFVGAGVVWNQTAVHAELMGYVRGLFDRAGVVHQAATWRRAAGKTEGGTVLPFFTELGMSGLVVGIPLLSMHAPFEVVSKVDLYEGYRAYAAFLAD